MSATKKTSGEMQVRKLAPDSRGARDQGPRLIPLQDRKKPTDGESSKKFMELADIALAKKRFSPLRHSKAKRSA